VRLVVETGGIKDKDQITASLSVLKPSQNSLKSTNNIEYFNSK
jgi:hypothetical protein